MLRVVALVGMAVIIPASVSADEKADNAIKALQGNWKVEKLVAGGQSVPAETATKMTFTFTDSTGLRVR